MKFKFPSNNSKALLAGTLNFKSRIVFWRFGDLKKESHFLKKATFNSYRQNKDYKFKRQKYFREQVNTFKGLKKINVGSIKSQFFGC